MSNENAPFAIGQKLVCIIDTISKLSVDGIKHFEKGDIVTVSSVERHRYFPTEWAIGLEEAFKSTDKYWWKHFAPINPYSSDATQELIEKIEIGDGVDQPVKVIVNN